jgi:hypothetical protein
MAVQDEAAEDDTSTCTAGTGTGAARRLVKLVLADEADRLLIAYEYERFIPTPCGHADAEAALVHHVMTVGNYVELRGPIKLVQGVAMLQRGCIGVAGGSSSSSSSSFVVAASNTPNAQPLHNGGQVYDDSVDWIDELPSDLFQNEVIVIDE